MIDNINCVNRGYLLAVVTHTKSHVTSRLHQQQVFLIKKPIVTRTDGRCNRQFFRISKAGEDSKLIAF